MEIVSRVLGHVRDFPERGFIDRDVFGPAGLSYYNVALSEVLTISHDGAKSSGALINEKRGHHLRKGGAIQKRI